MILGCLLLVLVLNRYEFKTKAAAMFSPTAPATLVAQLEKSADRGSVHL